MWTPKRILMLSAAFVVLTLVYLLYSATALGRINTLPPLPDQYKATYATGDSDPVIRPPGRQTALERKMEKAFGIACKELTWPVRMEVNTKSMVIAAGQSEPTEDGRVLLKPLSLAIFGKKKNDAGEVEINTLCCEQAYITFDRPITALSPGELNGRKVTKAELYGNIKVVNNRRTAPRDDDLTVDIATGPLHYIEKKQFIWTNDVVHLRDGQLTPPKADIVAKGMEMELATSAPPPKPGVVAHKPKNESISGVKRIVLKQDVTMHLYVSGGTPFPGGDKGAAKKAEPPGRGAAKPPPELSHIVIRTPGRFQYDIFKDHDLARFDVPEDGDRPNSPQDVTVERINERLDTRDQLVCKHLELRVKRRDGEPAKQPAATPAPEQGLEIETAHATGPEVTLTSDAEKLDAHGNDFFYDAPRKLSILKGAPFMEANREESLIQAPELRIQDVPVLGPPGTPPRTYQQVQATGPGSIHMNNKTTGKKTTHAFWKDRLLSTRDGEMDLLLLVGDARFEDEVQRQSLKAETLKVWLLAENKKPEVVVKAAPAAGSKGAASPEQSRRPHRIEALRHVVAHSPTLNIPEAARLVIRFTDVPASRMPPPSAANPQDKKTSAAPPLVTARTTAASAANAPTVGAARRAGPDGAARLAGPTAAPANKVAVGAPTAAPAPPRPIDLTARSIEADVLRCGERNALDHLWTEGDVKVRQDPDPAKPDERGVYIKGDTLDMKCSPEGNVLNVTGDLAQLEMDKILILGPTVRIDQARNEASVEGEGAMRMQSNQSLEGKPLGRTVPLTVHWSKYMLFVGSRADFYGGIQAEQENARLACQSLQVQFDRPISLKEGARGEQPAKISKLVGDKDVRVEDSAYDRNNQLLKYQLFEGREIRMTTEARDDGPRPAGASSDTNDVWLSASPASPGSVRIFQPGGADFAAAPPRPAAAPPPASAKQEYKLTYISFQRQMRASNRTNTADFWGSVRVLNLPCDDPHREIDLDVILATELPAGAMYLRCNRLKVLSHPPQNGKSHQEMQADGQVFVEAREFRAQSDHMTYNEAKDQVIFTADPGNLAVLAKVIAKGAPPQTIRAKRITYVRSTGQWSTEEVDTLSGN